MIDVAMWTGGISIIATFRDEAEYKTFLWMHDYRYCGDGSYVDDNGHYAAQLSDDKED